MNGFQVPHEFLAGWAVRPKKGKMYGAKYIGEFRAEIKSLFDRGEVSSAEKIGPGGMLEVLRLKHPTRFDFPSENEIRQEISRLKRKPSSKKSFCTDMQMEKQCEPGESDKKERLTDAHVRLLKHLLATNPQRKPRDVEAEFRATYMESRVTKNQLSYMFKKLKSSVDAAAQGKST